MFCEAPFYTSNKATFLPRQARDKHRETTQTKSGWRFLIGEDSAIANKVLHFLWKASCSEALPQVRKHLLLLSTFHIKWIILPRQARDKHRESSTQTKSGGVFFCFLRRRSRRSRSRCWQISYMRWASGCASSGRKRSRRARSAARRPDAPPPLLTLLLLLLLAVAAAVQVQGSEQEQELVQ
jgi:hypothetical protein